MKSVLLFRSIVIVIILETMTGCTTMMTQPMTAANKAEIHTVMINKNVKMPATVYYAGPGLGPSILIGGIIGGAIYDMNQANGATKLQKIITQDNIHVDQLVINQFQQQMKDNTNFELVNQPPADAYLLTEIKEYGLSIPHGFSMGVEPILLVNAQLVRDNKIIWQSGCYVNSYTSGKLEHPVAEFEQNPALLNQEFNSVAAQCVQTILSTLK